MTLTLIILLLPSFIQAEKGGLVSGEFLSLGAGARAIAMGETGAASVKDSYASWWNPAALTSLKSPEAALMHNKHFEDITQQYLVFAYPVSRLTTALSLTRLAVEPFGAYDGNGNSLGTTQASDLSIGLALGLKLRDNFSLGATSKWLQEKLDSNKASVLAGDFGILYELRLKEASKAFEALRIGASYANLSRGLRFDRDRFSLPQTLRLGLSSQHNLLKQNFSLSLDGVFPKKSESFIAVGTEWRPQEFLALRAGLRGSQDIGSGLRLGFGLNIQQFSLDYAWAGFGDFGATHRISLKIQFDRFLESQKSRPKQPAQQEGKILKPQMTEPQQSSISPISNFLPAAPSHSAAPTQLNQNEVPHRSYPTRPAAESERKTAPVYPRKAFPWRVALGILGVLTGGLLLGLALYARSKITATPSDKKE